MTTFNEETLVMCDFSDIPHPQSDTCPNPRTVEDVAGQCISCGDTTNSQVLGLIGVKRGPICAPCEVWCGSNIIAAVSA